MSAKQPVQTDNAPGAVGPYSQGMIAGGFIFTAGQLGVNPETKALEDGVQAQTRQALANVQAVLEAAGSSLGHVIKTTVFLQNMDDFAAMNEVYQQAFDAAGAAFPSRSAVEVARLPLGGLVEIEAIALLPE
jgi:2-iminobutanoate/2-iminopropanoate deaminase